jgi:hypothetical protein
MSDEAERAAKIIADPEKLAAASSIAQPTPYLEALSNCHSLAERFLLVARVYGNEAAASLMTFNRLDARSLHEAAKSFDKADIADLAGLARDAASKAKRKVSAAVSTKAQAKKASRRAYLKAMAKVRRK